MTAFDTAAATIFANAHLYVSATYTPPTGPAVACSVILTKDIQQQPATEAYIPERYTTIAVRKAQVDQPKRGGTFLVGSTTYTVDKIFTDDGIIVTSVVH